MKSFILESIQKYGPYSLGQLRAEVASVHSREAFAPGETVAKCLAELVAEGLVEERDRQLWPVFRVVAKRVTKLGQRELFA